MRHLAAFSRNSNHLRWSSGIIDPGNKDDTKSGMEKGNSCNLDARNRCICAGETTAGFCVGNVLHKMDARVYIKVGILQVIVTKTKIGQKRLSQGGYNGVNHRTTEVLNLETEVESPVDQFINTVQLSKL